jgi:hypothetical protein
MRLGLIILVLLLISKENSAQKFLIVSDSLKQLADEIPGKVGTQWAGKMHKISFGSYRMTESKMGWEKSTTKSRLFDRKITTTTNQKFSFKFVDGKGLSTNTNFTTRIEVELLREITLLSISGKHTNFTISNDEELLIKDNQLNAIIISGDTTETWTFMLRSVEGSEVNGHLIVGSLTNGPRKLYLFPVSKGDDKFPALGFKLIENEKEVAALQFFGGGVWGANKNTLWLLKDLDPKTKIIIASAFSAVLQTRVGAMTF